jgi:hypothetical protein
VGNNGQESLAGKGWAGKGRWEIIGKKVWVGNDGQEREGGKE